MEHGACPWPSSWPLFQPTCSIASMVAGFRLTRAANAASSGTRLLPPVCTARQRSAGDQRAIECDYAIGGNGVLAGSLCTRQLFLPIVDEIVSSNRSSAHAGLTSSKRVSESKCRTALRGQLPDACLQKTSTSLPESLPVFRGRSERALPQHGRRP